ncbi:type VI secretion system tube protein Hcp [Caulobacter flavus]|jgi:type VI secretion system secreted protein Hcp|uniref:Type VI secretion system tube protein Hcp n=1 Tax=Caulobacter flavus TaxID=1679497 RepID=A0A2N5CZE6_9CAUL|nr:type VI secretion system tube protein Hcp [Caulobacter flavus]AYV45140.1 type VI secretion system tube protein Hcp [Caulobacter flavus]PLR19180.1 type VI secretion system tube protein Hcp [Caulobacter flavus]
MPADIFLKIDGIKGESKDDKHKDEIEIQTWAWEIKNTGSAHFGSGMGAGKMQAGDLLLEKRIDVSTPALLRACATGKHIASATLVARKDDGDKKLEYFKIELKDILISSVESVSIDLTKSDITKEQRAFGALERVSLNFAEFKVVYITQTQGGGSGPQVEFGYNIAQNKTA